MTSMDVRVSAAGMVELGRKVFTAAGAEEEEASSIAANLADSNLAGHDSHGVVRIPRYVKWARTGNLFFGRSVDTVLDGGGFLLMDGNRGFGQVIGGHAVDAGIERAKEGGLAIVGLRNSGHLGRIGFWAERACRQGVNSIHFVNVAQSMLVAPFGAAERRVSTAPVTIGVCNGEGGDFILDFATSMVAEGKVLVALGGGDPPPEGSLIDGGGEPTLDPRALYGDVAADDVPDPRDGPGALLTMGDHKGSGLALACELLAGALTGSGVTGPGKRTHNGMLSIYLRDGLLDDGHGAALAVRNYINHVRTARPADPEKPVMIPGDPERRSRQDRLANGFVLAGPVWENILDTGASLGLSADDLKRTALFDG